MIGLEPVLVNSYDAIFFSSPALEKFMGIFAMRNICSLRLIFQKYYKSSIIIETHHFFNGSIFEPSQNKG